MVKDLVEGVRHKAGCAGGARLQLMKIGAGILLHHGKAMPGKAGLVEMESGSGTRGHQPAEEAKESCRCG